MYYQSTKHMVKSWYFDVTEYFAIVKNYVRYILLTWVDGAVSENSKFQKDVQSEIPVMSIHTQCIYTYICEYM